MEWIIFKINNDYFLTTLEAVEDFKKHRILPYDYKAKTKKDIINYAETNTKYKNLDKKTFIL